MYIDVTEPIALDDKSVDYILAEHLIEHLEYHQAVTMLQECRRILKPGGRIRIVTPGLDNFIGMCNGKKAGPKRYIQWVVEKYYPQALTLQPCFAVNSIFYGFGHKFIYDHATLKTLLKQAGFSRIRRQAPAVSEDENFCNIDGHGKVIGEEFNHFESLVLEARSAETV